MTDVLSLYPEPPPRSKFELIGYLPSPQFQKCRYLLQKITDCYPELYERPNIRGMLNVDWDDYLTKMRRLHGKDYYLLQSPVAVFYNDELLGDDRALTDFISEKYSIDITEDFDEMGEKELIRHFLDITENQRRKFAFLSIAIDEHIVGSMLFMLYSDLVPVTCQNFLERCKDKSPTFGYKNTRFHRIAKYSWIQSDDHHLHKTDIPCENYAIPHNRKGVLSMCNTKRYENNSTSFFITLDSTPWMDYNYVAFGQLVQGIEILNLIEKITTFHQKPTRIIKIVNCGEFSMCPEARTMQSESMLLEQTKSDDVVSILSQTDYKAGKYHLKTDLRSYLPFTRYSKLFDDYLKDMEEDEETLEDHLNNIEEAEESHEEKIVFHKSGQFYFRPRKSMAGKATNRL